MDIEAQRVESKSETEFEKEIMKFGMPPVWMLNKCGRTREKEWPWNDAGDNRSYSAQSHFRSTCYENRFLDINTKKAAIKASKSVVSLVSYSGNDEMFQCTGTVIEEDGTILTSSELVTCRTSEHIVADNLKVLVYLLDGNSYEARLLAYDFYYGIAIVKIKENVPRLEPACIRLIDDRISLDSSELHIDNNNKGFKLRPGEKVIAIGRYHTEPYDLVAAPGEFLSQASDGSSIHRSDKELFTTSCLITDSGIGGPLINLHAEVIGVAFGDIQYTPFLPINIALKWWEYHKNYGELRHQPLLGMKMANLYTVRLLVMEKILLKFPNYVAGAIVEDVDEGSSAGIAGICPNDLIVNCCGKPVGSFLEFCDMMWDKIGDSVNLVVLRASADDPLEFEIKAVKARRSMKRRMSFEAEESNKRTKVLEKGLVNLLSL